MLSASRTPSSLRGLCLEKIFQIISLRPEVACKLRPIRAFRKFVTNSGWIATALTPRRHYSSPPTANEGQGL